MAVYSGMFNSVNGDRKYNAWWFAKYFSTFIGNGVFPNPSNNLQVVENDNMTTTVKPGTGWINGYFIYSDNDYILQHDLADGVLRRIDRVVMRLDYLSRQIEINIKKGAYASTPVAPALQRDADAFELALADVMINNGATVITQANITDQRLNNSLCGRVHGTVDQVDTSTIFDQYQSWIVQQKDIYEADLTNWTADQHADFLSWRADEEGLFNEWFESIKDILDEDAAGNLLLMIEEIINSKGQPGGYPELDDEGKVPIGQLPPMDYIPTSEKGAPGGVATLGSDGKLLLSQSRENITKGSYSRSITLKARSGSTYTITTVTVPLGSSVREIWLTATFGSANSRLGFIHFFRSLTKWVFSQSGISSYGYLAIAEINHNLGSTFTGVLPKIIEGTPTFGNVAIVDIYMSGANLIIKVADVGGNRDRTDIFEIEYLKRE